MNRVIGVHPLLWCLSVIALACAIAIFMILPELTNPPIVQAIPQAIPQAVPQVSPQVTPPLTRPRWPRLSFAEHDALATEMSNLATWSDLRESPPSEWIPSIKFALNFKTLPPEDIRRVLERFEEMTVQGASSPEELYHLSFPDLTQGLIVNRLMFDIPAEPPDPQSEYAIAQSYKFLPSSSLVADGTSNARGWLVPLEFVDHVPRIREVYFADRVQLVIGGSRAKNYHPCNEFDFFWDQFDLRRNEDIQKMLDAAKMTLLLRDDDGSDE